MIYNEHAIAAFERYRPHFINSLGSFKSLMLTGTKNRDRSENRAEDNMLRYRMYSLSLA
ncbi:hypothetical protein [Sphingobacterium sp.]|uniref:hypothetical protein n=1 Tax=Sphingobacterium sp. TaxID=341027 RepID=UPI0031DAED6A